MKKRLILLTVLTLLLVVVFTAPTQKTAYAEDSSPIIALSGKKVGDGLQITASLKRNSGIYAMKLELVYDTSSMTLTGYTRGASLSSMHLTTTNPETEKGFAITPFVFYFDNYENTSQQNDTTTGTMLILNFKIVENAPKGDSFVTFKYEKNADIICLDGEIKTQNALIGRAKVSIDGEIKAIESQDAEQEKTQDNKNGLIATIVCCTLVGAAGIITVCCVVAKRKKGKKGWQKL